MNRKDTIMIAVMVNAVLLIALFVSAIRNNDERRGERDQEVIAELNPTLIQKPKKEKVTQVAQEDAIDQVLKEFSKKEVVKVEEAPGKIDFAKELEAITKAAAQKTKPQATPRSTGVRSVTVKKGDVLARIARANNCTVNEIINVNHLSNTVLQIGQSLKIPNKSGAVSKAKSEYYIVKQGDNPWTIAVKNQIKVDELLRLNDLNEDKARRLRPGDKLRIK